MVRGRASDLACDGLGKGLGRRTRGISYRLAWNGSGVVLGQIITARPGLPSNNRMKADVGYAARFRRFGVNPGSYPV